MGPEAYGIGGVALAVIAILMVFVKSLVKRQDQIIEAASEGQERIFEWFTKTMNGTLDSLKDTLANNRQAMQTNADAMAHNTKNLKQTQELLAGVLDKILTAEKENNDSLHAKLDELIGRDRSKTRENDREGGE